MKLNDRLMQLTNRAMGYELGLPNGHVPHLIRMGGQWYKMTPRIGMHPSWKETKGPGRHEST